MGKLMLYTTKVVPDTANAAMDFAFHIIHPGP